MKRLAIIGSGDLGSQIAYHGEAGGHYTIVGFCDDFETKGSLKNKISILGSTNDILSAFKDDVFDVLMIGIGYRHFGLRRDLFNRFYGTIPFGKIIHGSAFVDPSCQIGEGVIIYPGCVLDMNVKIHQNVLINAGCVIAHDSTVCAHSFLSPAVKIAGFVTVGQQVSLGIGTILIDNLEIADYVRTGAGAVVIKNLERAGLYVGVPAAFKK